MCSKYNQSITVPFKSLQPITTTPKSSITNVTELRMSLNRSEVIWMIQQHAELCIFNNNNNHNSIVSCCHLSFIVWKVLLFTVGYLLSVISADLVK